MTSFVLKNCVLALLLLVATSAIPAIAGPDAPSSFDSSRSNGSAGNQGRPSKTSSSSSSRDMLTCNSKNIVSRGSLAVAARWLESAPLTLDFVPLQRAQCVGYTITAEALADTACAEKSSNHHILVEFWQLGPNSTRGGGSIGGPGSGRDGLPKVPYNGLVVDIKVLAARGTQPSLTWGAEDTFKVVPPVRDPTTGLTPVGSFQDDAGVMYSRPALRILFPTDSPVTDVGEPADPDAWYITIANMQDHAAMPAYAIRASCITVKSHLGDLRIGAAATHNSSDSTKKAAEASLPCPVPSPGGKQCNGHGTCRTDTSDSAVEYTRYCACDAGWGSWACQMPLLSLPLNVAEPVVATIPPGKWEYWEVNLPPWQGPSEDSSDVPTAAHGSGGSTGSNEQLLLMAERLPSPGMGGNPLLFLKPFDTKDHNEPALDGITFDLVNYADLRSFQLQLNRQFINYRLPLRDSRGMGRGSRIYSRPQRWYVAIYNSNVTRLSEPARVRLWVQYRDLNRQPVACPFDCNGRGRCVDPLSLLQTMRGGMQQGLAQSKNPDIGAGLNPGSAGLMALGPLQDLSPMDAGFMCSCSQGFGGLLCEGRVQNLTIGSGEQKLGPELLEPGSWFYYVVTVDSGFNPHSDNLGIQWIVGQPSAPPSNYTTAYISFDQGPLQRQQQLMGMSRQQVRRGMTPYSKLLVRSNPPLPLQVPGGQLNPAATYIVSIFNNDYVTSMRFMYSLSFYVIAESNSYLHPYMSILLGVTAAVILCLAMTLCKRVVVRYGFVPWRWRQRQRQLQAAAAQNGLALVLMAQSQPVSLGVPPEIYQAFPCRPFAVKEFQKRQHEVQQQDVAAAAAAAAGGGGEEEEGHLSSDIAPGQDQNTKRPHTAASTDAAAVDADVEIGHAAAGCPPPAAHAVGDHTPAQQQQQQHQHRWRLSHIPWSTNASKGDDTTTPTAAAAPPSDVSKADLVGACDGDGSLVKDDDAPSCSVCLCEYASGELVRQLPCNHEFHQSCIDQWMVSHGTCPICRAPLWAGALEHDAADDMSSSRADDPAAIYVHHDMPAARTGFGGAADADSLGDRDWARRLRQWRERSRQQLLQRHQQRQQRRQRRRQQVEHLQEFEAPAAQAAGANDVESMAGWQQLAVAHEQQQQERQQRRPAISAAAQPPHQQHQDTAPPSATQEPLSDIALAPSQHRAERLAPDHIMGAFSLGRRRQHLQQPPPQQQQQQQQLDSSS